MYRIHLDKLVRTRLDDILVGERVLDRERLEAAQAEQDQSGRQLSDVLIDSGAIDDWELARLIASHYSLPFVDVAAYSVPANVLELLPLDWCRTRGVLPIDQFGKTIALACVEVPTAEIVQEIVEKTGCTPFLYAAARRPIRDLIDESLKRRGAHSLHAHGRPAAAQAAKPAVNTPVPTPVAAAPAAPVVPAPPPVALPADLPRISLQLNANAAHLGGHGAAPAPAPKRPQVAENRPPRPAMPVPAHDPHPPASPAPAPVQKVSAMQAILGRNGGGNGAANGAPEMPAVQKAAPRAAPVLPAAGPAATPPAGGGAAWESIFDMGDSAVKRAPTPEPRRKSQQP